MCPSMWNFWKRLMWLLILPVLNASNLFYSHFCRVYCFSDEEPSLYRLENWESDKGQHTILVKISELREQDYLASNTGIATYHLSDLSLSRGFIGRVRVNIRRVVWNTAWHIISTTLSVSYYCCYWYMSI